VSGAAPPDLGDWLDPARVAVVVVDMQVDFADPQGRLGRSGVDLSSTPAALAAASELVSAAREAGAAVIFVGLQTCAATDSAVWLERGRRSGAGASAPLCRTGERGADFVGPKPGPADSVVAKTRYSGFFRTNLDLVLQGRRVDTVVLCGMTTECCVAATARDAFERDYHVFVVSDACAAYEADLHRLALKSLELNCATILWTEDLVRVWQARPIG
jgi:nicotinamidase-related amidase